MGILDGRVAIVTGGGRGLGRAHCLELAGQGATVVVNDVGVGVHGEADAETPADEVVTEIAANGGTAVTDGTSVSDFDGVAAMIVRTVERFGRLDAIVNNAGIVRDAMLTNLSESDWDAVLAVHLKGAFNLTHHACVHWRQVAKDGGRVTGRIVNTTSGTGLLGNMGQANYGAAKAAIANLTIITAMEMQRYNVTANAISPLALTRMTSTIPSLANRELTGDWDPLDPSNFSPVVAWLASEESGWLTGQVFRLEGNVIRRMRPWEIDQSFAYQAKGGKTLETTEIGNAMRLLFGVQPRGTTAVAAVTK